jgi:hypothetical protein
MLPDVALARGSSASCTSVRWSDWILGPIESARRQRKVSGPWCRSHVNSSLDSALLTRRALLRAGAVATAATMLGVCAQAAAPAVAAVSHLVRSSYTGLAERSFAVGAVDLQLQSISDVAGAALQPSLVASENAFVLSFSGPLAKPLASGTHTVRHPAFGTFDLFISPIMLPSAHCQYEAVIDRSVGRRALATT